MTADLTADLVVSERHGSVLLLTLNRPETLNAWSDALEDRYFDSLESADADPAVRAVVVTGAGRGFCSGADMNDLQQAETLDARGLLRRRRPKHHPVSMRKPLIAAINGAAAGLGLVEALFCDVRFATPEAKLTTAFARRGLIAEYSISWLLPRIVGPGRALDLLLTGRIVTGDEALRIGLVDRVVDAEELVGAAIAYAQELAAHSSPLSMSVIKRQVYADLDSSLKAATDRAEPLMIESLQGPDVREGVASYLEGRAPAFAPLPVGR